ncbi:MFS transporter [Streptomyces sp. NPDC093221]|uniref:MFS transporter n=1 Tax=Streptomyces sp. NPDC093221 TaxID=3366032 RepID=UPI003824A72E
MPTTTRASDAADPAAQPDADDPSEPATCREPTPAPEPASASDRDPRLDSGPAQGPGSDREAGLTSAPAERPGSGEETALATGQGPEPGSGNEANPASGSAQEPASGREAGADSGPAQGGGSGKEANPASGSAQEPASGREAGADSGPAQGGGSGQARDCSSAARGPAATGSGAGAGSGGVRPTLVTRELLLRCATIVGASASFFLLLSVVPLYAERSGASGGAGLASGTLMLATVCGELATPRLVARYGYRRALAAGLVLLGAPALVLTASDGMAWIAAVCFVRGVGFALTIVAGGALTATLIPAERRGEGLALAGAMEGVPSFIALPLGVWFAAHVGYTAVCVAGGLLALAAVAVVPALPGHAPTGDGHKAAVGVLAGFRTGALARPTAVFATTALGVGIIVTFLPLAVPSGATGLVAAALFVQPAASTAANWFAGRSGDRHGSQRLVLPALLLSASGLLLTALTGSAVAVLTGVALFGVGFGMAQNATLALMYARVPESGYGTVSALWNSAYDAGMGFGALGYGALAAATGYPLAFTLTAGLMLAALVPALGDRRRPSVAAR